MDNLPDNIRNLAPYFLYENRLKSFTEKWPHYCYSLIPEMMAQAGFFYAPDKNNPDNVLCPFCLKNLTCWESDDDPIVEHAKRKSNCFFMQLNKSETDYTVEDFLKLAAASRAASWEEHLRASLEEIKEIKKGYVAKFTKALEDTSNKGKKRKN